MHMADWEFERVELSDRGVTVSWEFRGDGRYGKYNRMVLGDKPYMRLVIQADGKKKEIRTRFYAKKYFNEKYMSLMAAISYTIFELEKGVELESIAESLSTIDADNYYEYDRWSSLLLDSLVVA